MSVATRLGLFVHGGVSMGSAHACTYCTVRAPGAVFICSQTLQCTQGMAWHAWGPVANAGSTAQSYQLMEDGYVLTQALAKLPALAVSSARRASGKVSCEGRDRKRKNQHS